MTRERDGKLSDRAIRHLTPGTHRDGRGLYMQVVPTGARTWLLRTVIQGKRRWMGLGGYPTVSLSEAREKALRYRKIARDGGDPFVERDKSRAPIPIFEVAAESVHKEHSASWKNAKHQDQWINTLRDYIFPTLGKLRVDAIKSGDIMRAVGPIWLEKPETARRVIQRIGTVLLWAKGRGFRSDAPSEEIAAARKALPKQTDTVTHHTAMPYADVPEFIKRLRKSSVSDSVALGLEFLILTATRTGEILDATWGEIDFEAKDWTIPADRMKAKREHRIPLSDRCMEILAQARNLSEGTGHIFPGTITGKPLSNMTFLMMLRRTGSKITSHGFRSSFRDWGAEKTNFPREVCEAALAHAIGDATEAAYKRTDFFEKRRELMEAWARHCTAASAEVIPLQKRAS